MEHVLKCDICFQRATCVLLVGGEGFIHIADRSWTPRCENHPSRADGLLIGAATVIKIGE